MTKAEFLEALKENGEFGSMAETKRALNAFTDTVTKALADKKKVSLIGFGTFSTVELEEKTGKVPGTNKEYTKPAHTAPRFKFGKTIKDTINL